MSCLHRDQSGTADTVRYTIIDEADEMVSPDWVDDMRMIMGGGKSIKTPQ